MKSINVVLLCYCSGTDSGLCIVWASIIKREGVGCIS